MFASFLFFDKPFKSQYVFSSLPMGNLNFLHPMECREAASIIQEGEKVKMTFQVGEISKEDTFNIKLKYRKGGFSRKG
jgi:hypothetical protein